MNEYFKCKRCGLCCRWGGYVYLTDKDIAALAEATGLSEDEFIEKHTRLSPARDRLCLLDAEGDACEFLTENGCKYYDARPQQCRDYPEKWRAPQRCPGFEK